MAAPLSPRTRRLGAAVFAFACVLGVDLLGESSSPDELLVFAMSVRTHDGRVVGSPVVVGAPGQRVEVRLACSRNPAREKMSLVLDPLAPADDGTLRYAWSLSVGGRLQSEQGRVTLLPGVERSFAVRPEEPSRSVTLALFAAPASTPGLGTYLKQRRARLAAADT